MPDRHTFRNQRYELTVSGKGFKLTHSAGRRPFLESPLPLLLFPEIAGCEPGVASWSCVETTASRVPMWTIDARMKGFADARAHNHIYLMEDRIVCVASYEAARPHELTGWGVAPPGGSLYCDRIHTLSGKNGAPDDNGTWHEQGELRYSTATHNWMYGAAAPRVLLYDGSLSALIGGTRPAGDYGLELAYKGVRIEYFRFDYGGANNPLPCPAGESVRGPRLQIQCGSGLTPERAHAAFTGGMAEDGVIDEKRYGPEDRSWRRPWYCTWGDQNAIAGGALNQKQWTTPSYEDIKAVLTRDFVEKAARFIRERDLNIGTIIIDDGWQDKHGDWNLATEKFPDMRSLSDSLHGMGFKVALWWAPFLVEQGAEILKRPELIAGPTKKHGEMVVDYSRPRAREWIGEKLETWFGSGPGCWNLDGVKLDFLLEKIYPESQNGDEM